MEGVGAFELPVPPLAAVYHSNEVPVAVKAVAAVFWQYVTGLVTGADGTVFTVTVEEAEEEIQPFLSVTVTE